MDAIRAVARSCLLAGLAIVLWIPLTGFLASDAPAAGRVLVAVLAALAALRPADALVVASGVLPLGRVIGTLAHAPFGLTEPLVAALLAGWCTNGALHARVRLSAATRQLLQPVLLFAVAVAASSAVGLAGRQPFTSLPGQYLRDIAEFFWSGYFADPNRFEPLTSGLQVLEGIGLFTAAAVLVDRQPMLRASVLRTTAVAAFGVAALSVNRLAEVVLRAEDSWSALRTYVATIRISAAFPDQNAAGSYFAMAVVLAAGIGRGARRLRWLWCCGAGVLVAAWWLTGSRAALLAVPIAMGIGISLGLRAVSGHRWRHVSASLLTLLVVVGMALVPLLSRDARRPGLANALQIRWELTRSALAMAATYPTFGVGIGGFRAASSGFVTPTLQRYFQLMDVRDNRENAHNNFLQVLAELGVVGFVPFVWLLGAVARPIVRVMASGELDWPLAGAAGGLLAFLVTWLTGHPLLIMEVALPFWLLLGACRGGAPGRAETVDSGSARSWLRYLVPALALVLVLTVPARAQFVVAHADLSGASVGLSAWEKDEAATPFRWMDGPRAQFYVPMTATGMHLPLRLKATDGRGTVDVAIALDGQPANRVRLVSGDWNVVGMVLPRHDGRRFRQIELFVPDDRRGLARTAHDSDDAGSLGIQVGKPILTPRR